MLVYQRVSPFRQIQTNPLTKNIWDDTVDGWEIQFEIFAVGVCMILRLFQHTELEHTLKKPLLTDYKGNPFIIG